MDSGITPVKGGYGVGGDGDFDGKRGGASPLLACIVYLQGALIPNLDKMFPDIWDLVPIQLHLANEHSLTR